MRREIDIEWQGEEYTCCLNMAVRTELEAKGIFPADILLRIGETDKSPGKFPYALLSQVVFQMLRKAGAPVTLDDVYEAVRTGGFKPDQSAEVINYLVESETSGPGQPAKKKPEKKAKKAAK